MRVKVAYISKLKQIKPPMVGEHAFPLTGFFCWSANATFGGSGWIRSTDRPELPYPLYFPGKVLGRDFSEGEVMCQREP